MTFNRFMSGTQAVGVIGALATAAMGLAPSPSLAEEVQVEEILVTAQRRVENIQDVPISVSTLSGERLATIFSSGEDIRALAARVPSLYAESSNARVAPRFYIRGLGNTDFDLAASQPVSIIMDDVVMENVVLKSSPLFDIEQVEVLRGPQGTLFGRNTTAGIVKFTSKKPTDELEGYLTATAGTLNTATAEGAIGGAIIPGKLSTRISMLVQHRGNYVDNGFTGENNAMGGYTDLAGRVQLLFTPTEALSALLNIHGRDLKGTAALFRANILGPGNNKLNANFDRDTVYYDGGDNNPQKYNGFGSSLTLDYDFGPAKMTSITAYETTQGLSRGDIDGGFGAAFLPFMGPGFIPFPSDTQDNVDDLDQFTQEVRLASTTSDPFFWQVGAYYFHSDLYVTTNPFFVPPTQVEHRNSAWAMFGQGSYKVTDALTVTAGVRYTKDNKNFFTATLPETVLSDDNVSWDASVAYALSQDVNVYVRAATGFRAPSIQGRDVAFGSLPSTAGSETIKSYEAGVKTELFGRRARVNFSGFYYTLNDMQFSAIGGGGNFVRLINADGGEAYGIEFDSQVAFTEHLMVTGGVSYTHTEIKDSTLTTAPCGSGLCTLLDPKDALGNAIIGGNPFPQAPKIIATVTARYGIPVGPEGEVFLFTDWSYQGKTNFFLYEAAEFSSDGNFEGGLKIGYAQSARGFEIALFARNITNEANVQGAIDFNNLTGFVNEPRILGVSISKKL